MKPTHIGFIIDGNRRWAKERGMPSFMGHYNGYKKAFEISDWAIKRKIPVLSFYVFSTENQKRTEREFTYLIKLLKIAYSRKLKKINDKGVRILVSGVNNGLGRNIVKIIRDTQEKTKTNTKLRVNLCFNYSGRTEIIEAIKKIKKKNISSEKITEELLSENMFQQLPDPDIIVRTGGDQRLSNFLTWQSVYSELIFIKKHWPAFTKSDFDNVLKEYSQCKRRYGR